MNRRLALLSLPVVACLALTACSGSSKPSASSSASPSTSSSPSSPASATPGQPNIPAYAKTDDVHGQKGFATFWVQTLNKATDNGDTTTMKAIQAPSCAVCTSFAQTLDEIYGAGGNVKTAGWTIKSLVPIAHQPANNPGLQMNLSEAPQVVTEKKGAKPRPHAGGDASYRFFMVRSGDHWLVQRVEV